MSEGAVWGALGGGIEGLISEFMDLDGNGTFDWGNVGIKAGTGAVIGGLGKLYQAYKYGTLINTSLFKSIDFDYFVLGIGQALLQDFALSRKGNGGLNAVDAGISAHNFTMDMLAESVNAGW
jgi:hypothetical protein